MSGDKLYGEGRWMGKLRLCTGSMHIPSNTQGLQVEAALCTVVHFEVSLSQTWNYQRCAFPLAGRAVPFQGPSIFRRSHALDIGHCRCSLPPPLGPSPGDLLVGSILLRLYRSTTEVAPRRAQEHLRGCHCPGVTVGLRCPSPV